VEGGTGWGRGHSGGSQCLSSGGSSAGGGGLTIAYGLGAALAGRNSFADECCPALLPSPCCLPCCCLLVQIVALPNLRHLALTSGLPDADDGHSLFSPLTDPLRRLAGTVERLSLGWCR